MAEFVFGSAGYIKFGSTVLSSDERTFTPEESIGLADATAGNDTARTRLATIKDGKASWEGVLQAGGTALWAAVAPGVSGTLEWGEEGTATGKPKHTVVAIVESRKREFPYEDIAVAQVEFVFSGGAAVTDTAY